MHFPVTNSPTNPFAPAPLEIVRNFPTQIIRDREARGEDTELKRGERREHYGGQNYHCQAALFIMMTWRLEAALRRSFQMPKSLAVLILSRLTSTK